MRSTRKWAKVSHTGLIDGSHLTRYSKDLNSLRYEIGVGQTYGHLAISGCPSNSAIKVRLTVVARGARIATEDKGREVFLTLW